MKLPLSKNLKCMTMKLSWQQTSTCTSTSLFMSVGPVGIDLTTVDWDDPRQSLPKYLGLVNPKTFHYWARVASGIRLCACAAVDPPRRQTVSAHKKSSAGENELA